MNTPKCFAIVVPLVLLELVHPCSSFVAPLESSLATPLLHGVQRAAVASSRTTTAIFYRPLDKDDDDSAMLKLNIRAPPGFNMEEAVAPVIDPKQPQQQQPSSAVNVGLIQALLLNQALILGLSTVVCGLLLFVLNGPSAFGNLSEILHWTGEGPGLFDLALSPTRILQGVGASLPLLAVSNLIEASDKRTFAQINFSTITLALTLFGRRKQPPDEFLPEEYQGRQLPKTNWPDALFWSLALSAMTGFCEETVFRRQVAGLLSTPAFLNGNVGAVLLGQAVLFALGHAQQGVSPAENGIVLGLQLFNGIGFGLIYILSGGDLVPCIIAHTLYDLVTFFKTWLDANGQLEYADSMYLQPLPTPVEKEVQAVLSQAPNKIDPRLFKTVKRLFFTFDFDKNKTLSRSEVRKGFAYMALEKAGIPPPQNQLDRLFDYAIDTRDSSLVAENDRDRLTFSDFMRMYSMATMKKQKPRRLSG